MIEVGSDGASSGGDDGAIGWGWLILQDGKILFSGYGGDYAGTNNQAELLGAINGLKAVIRAKILRPRESVVLVSDSQYVLGIASGAYAPNKNVELARELQTLARGLGADTRWVRGHQFDRKRPWQDQPHDVLINTRCDQLASLGKNQFVPEKALKKSRARKTV